MSLLHKIKIAKPEDLNDILSAVLARYREVFPDWEICAISIEKGTCRKEQIDRMIALLEKMK